MWTPLRPTRSGIADYVEELLPFLVDVKPRRVAGAEGHDLPTAVDIFTLDEPDSDIVRDHCAVLPPDSFEAIQRRRPYDALVYQIGSTLEHHRYICEQSMKYPGVLVMHDPNIHSYALAQIHAERGLQGYLDMVRDELGDEMVRLARQAWDDGTLSQSMVYTYNMDGWLLKHNRGVIYHSYFAMRDEQHRLPQVPSFYVPLYAPSMAEPNEAQRQRILARHQWSPDTVLIGTFGIMAPAKRVGVVLRAFQRVSSHHSGAVLVVVGSTAHYDVASEARQLGLDPSRVVVTGEVPMDLFLAYMQASDVGINLRYPSLGESSAVISRLVGMGKPIIVSDIAQFAELPDEFCWKLPVGDKEVDILAAYLDELVSDAGLRAQMGRAARTYGCESMSPELAALGYRSIAEHIFCDGPAPHLEDLIPKEYRQHADLLVQAKRAATL
jgi:glycosyltransferase involved in cell wall biosynthesis